MAQAKWTGRGVKVLLLLCLLGGLAYQGNQIYRQIVLEKQVLREMIKRLEADSRIAEAIVTDVQLDPATLKPITTIKFLEYASDGSPLAPKYFTFHGNIIQFQSLVVRFQDIHIRKADPLRDKSVYLFWKAFVLNGKNTEEEVITPVDEIPAGYKIAGGRNPLEARIWKDFWTCALDARQAGKLGIKNAQIEAPGTKFLPGFLYTLKIEHDGGIRIDPSPIPEVLRGENIR